MTVQNFIKWTILVACLVSTGFAEWDLAVWLGGNPWVACALPLVTDLYLIHATRNRVDTVPAVFVVIAVNAFDHTHTLMADWAKIPLSILIAALAPVVLWRLHATEHAEKPQDAVSQPAERPVTNWVPAIVPVPGVPDEPEPEPEPAEKMERQAALDKAEENYAYGVSVKQTALDTGYSEANVYRWYRAFKAAGVKKLVTA